MRRPRAAVAALAVAGLVAALGLLAGANPWGYVVLDDLARPLPWGVAVWVCVAAAVGLYRPRRAREWAGVALLTVVAAYSLYFTWLFAPGETLLARTPSPDGRYELRLVESADIDAEWTLRLRSRRGLLSRQRTIWTGRDSTEFAFTGAHTVEGIVDGVPRTIAFDPDSLEPR